MKLIMGLFLSASLLLSDDLSAKDLTHQLLEKAINNRLPVSLHSETEQRWEFGKYSIDVKKAGLLALSSNSQSITLQLPVHVFLTGDLNQTMLNMPMTLACKSDFKSEAIVRFSPRSAATERIDISLPIPPTDMLCGEIRMPIKAAIEGVIRRNKPEWEAQIADKVDEFLQQEGIRF